MECVLSHYEAGTEFYILARNFNKEAITLYQERFGFAPISQDAVTEFGYNKELYYGFNHTITDKEITAINAKKAPYSATDKATNPVKLAVAGTGESAYSDSAKLAAVECLKPIFATHLQRSSIKLSVSDLDVKP
jgi:hypothetical protein